MSTSLGALPRPVPRPLPGVTPPASPECPSPQSWGRLWGGCGVVGRGRGRWRRRWPMACSTRVFEVVGVIAGRGLGCPGGRWALLMAWTSLAFDVVGVPGGRGLGCRVSCSRPLLGVTLPASPECLSPQSRGWLWGCRRVAYVWSLPVSMAWVIRVFDVVGVVAGRGVGCGEGRCWPW